MYFVINIYVKIFLRLQKYNWCEKDVLTDCVAAIKMFIHYYQSRLRPPKPSLITLAIQVTGDKEFWAKSFRV